MPILTPTYSASYVNAMEQFTAVTYTLSSGAWTITPNGAYRIAIESLGGGDQALLINGFYSMFILSDGTVQTGDFTKNPMARGNVPRLDFLRQAGGQAVRVGSVTQWGVLNAWDIFEGVVPTGTDRMYLLGNTNCSIGPDGLLTPALEQMSILVDAAQWKAQPGNGILIDGSGKMLARFPG